MAKWPNFRQWIASDDRKHFTNVEYSVSEQNTINAKVDGTVEFDDVRTVESTDDAGNKVDTVVSRSTEMKVIDDLGNVRQTTNISYGTILSVKNGAKVQKGQVIAYIERNHE